MGLNGDIHQYVLTQDTAYANGVLQQGNRWPGPPDTNPNLLSISIETEDLGNPVHDVSAAQYEATRRVVQGVPTSVQYLVPHSAITPISKPLCPGVRWIASGLLNQLADETGLILVT